MNHDSKKEVLTMFLHLAGATVVEWLDCLPPTKANRVQSPARSLTPDDAAGWIVFSGISSFLHPYIPVLLHSHLISLSFTLKTSLLRSTHISLNIHLARQMEVRRCQFWSVQDGEHCHCQVCSKAVVVSHRFVVARPLASHLSILGLIPGGVAPRFSHVRIVPDDAVGYLPFPLFLHSGAATYSSHFTLIGSLDLFVKSHPNLSTLHSNPFFSSAPGLTGNKLSAVALHRRDEFDGGSGIWKGWDEVLGALWRLVVSLPAWAKYGKSGTKPAKLVVYLQIKASPSDENCAGKGQASPGAWRENVLTPGARYGHGCSLAFVQTLLKCRLGARTCQGGGWRAEPCRESSGWPNTWQQGYATSAALSANKHQSLRAWPSAAEDPRTKNADKRVPTSHASLDF
ncbi:hypothetical protein PR048_000866 [Dryococelus australis]|uniref:Uncharacterized protein n=1 Tax=Dryococelus australis TaxID=614101 RepID=A0ABQ9IFS6_9NEOP|nr:hypothetical protein PR048_000866 [Dryococelus australis]